MHTYGKNGQGAFRLAVFEAGESRTGVEVNFLNGQDAMHFDNPRAAYDHCRGVYDLTGDDAYWNVCYHLEDHLNN